MYGWPALRKQLQDDGSTLDESTLGAVFTVGAWSTQGGRFFSGLIRDRIGTKWVAASCTFLVALGSLGIAWSDPNNAIALGSSLFAMGLGSGAQLCVQPVAGLFPNTSGTVLASLSGAFQISGLVFLALTSGDNLGSRKVRFTAFAFLLVLLCVVAMILLPTGKSFILEDEEVEKTMGDVDEINGRLTSEIQDKPLAKISTIQDSSSVGVEEGGVGSGGLKNNVSPPGKTDEENVLDDSFQGAKSEEINKEDPPAPDQQPTAIEQIKSIEYILLCTWFSICLIPLQYYVGSIGFQLENKGDDDGFYTDLFSIMYASATVFSPAGGFLSDKVSLGATQGLATWMCAGSFFLLASNASLEAQVAGLLMYGVGRLLVFGMYFANCGKRFGYANFGTLAGLGLLISALFSLLQYPMISGAADGKSRAINIGSGVVLLVQSPYFVWLHRRERGLVHRGK